MRRTLWILAILVTGPMTGCFELADEDDGTDGGDEFTLGPNETDDPLQPTAGNNRLYLHSEETDDVWMDVVSDATSTALTGTVTASSEEACNVFDLRPASPFAFNLSGEKALAKITVTQGAQVGDGVRITMALTVDGQVEEETVVENAWGALEFEVDAPDHIPAQTPVGLEVCFGPMMTTVVAEYSLQTDGSSWLDLPISTPVYVQRPAQEGEEPPSEGDHRRDGGQVSTEQRNGRWVASRTVTLTGPVDGPGAIALDLETVAGGIDVSTTVDDGYEIVVILEGLGDSEQEARGKLDELRVTDGHDSDGQTMELSVLVDKTRNQNTWNNQSGRIQARVPAASTYPTVDVLTVSGGIDVRDLVAGRLDLETTSGGVRADVAEAADVAMSSSSGGLDLEVARPQGGTYHLHVSSGGINVLIPDGADYGWDATGDTVSGGVTIDLGDTEPVGDQSDDHKHVRTTDYDQRDIRTVLTAEATSGGVDIQGT